MTENSLSLTTDNWQYLHGKPRLSGSLKNKTEDFCVEEVLGFDLSNSGEHSFLWIKKTDTNTAFVGELLAKFAKVPLRNIGYAGRKDKYAVTYQWFSIYHANKPIPNWQKFSAQNVEIIKVSKHDKKLKTGALKSNKFKITINLSTSIDTDWLTSRIESIKRLGVPNYFGQQRFGEMRTSDDRLVLNGNLLLGEKFIQGEIIKNRNKRSMMISALRSWLFNQVVSKRIENEKIHIALWGDVMQLTGSKSYFVCHREDMPTMIDRLNKRDIQITAPMWGSGKQLSKEDAHAFENSVIEDYQMLCDKLSDIGLKQERRALLLYPEAFEYDVKGDILTLRFELPAGAFATSVIREIVNT